VNGSGVVSAAIVVTLKVSLTPPMVSVASVVVEKLFAEVCRTLTESPLSTLPTADVNVPLLIEYSPPVIEIGAVSLMPDTVMLFE